MRKAAVSRPNTLEEWYLDALAFLYQRYRYENDVFLDDIEDDEDVLIGQAPTPTARLSRQIRQIRHPPIVDVEGCHTTLFQIRGAIDSGSFPSGLSHTPRLGENLPLRLPISEGFDNVPWHILSIRLQMGVEFGGSSVIELV